MNNAAPFLMEAVDLKKDYPSPSGQLSILRGIQFNLAAAEIAFILGRSGSGKSTLLHLLGGLDSPSSGKILFEGQDITKWHERELARFRNIKVGFVFQFYHLLPELTVFENVILPMAIAGKVNHRWAKEILRRVKIISRRDYYPSELSGGEKQRVAIARALVNKPSIVLCDEPTGNLDEETAESVFALLNDLNKQEGQSLIIVTHDESLAWRYPRPVFRLHEGLLAREERGRRIDAKPAQQN
ncbi:MAG TPA: ABC transporter ATP-binding protein [bacterium]|nr:ABC transporter ATP-binding protein [bacterium]